MTEKQEAAEWVRSRPDAIKEMMRKFPPGCYVTGTKPLDCPYPGSMAQIRSYIEPDEENPEGLISVVGTSNRLGSEVTAYCAPSWLSVIEYHVNSETGDAQNEAWVEQVLSGDW